MVSESGDNVVELLRRLRESFEGRVDGLSASLGRGHDVPDAHACGEFARATAATLEALAELLEAIDAALVGAGSGDGPRPAPAAVYRALGLDDAADSPPAWQRGLAVLYGRVCERNHSSCRAVAWDTAIPADLQRLLPPKPGTDAARWAALVDVWTRVAYLGSTHAAGGLAARLATHPLDLVALARTPRETRRAWDRADLKALRALAAGIDHQGPQRRDRDGG